MSNRASELRRLFDEAVTLDPSGRAALLLDIGLRDPTLADELGSLLRADEDGAGTLDSYRDILHAYRNILGLTDAFGGRPLVGKTVGHFKLFDVLGAGGMGVVYRAFDLNLQRTVALKCLSGRLSLDKDARERLLKEARAAARLDHPNICPIYSVEETGDGTLFISMAYLGGQSLREKLRSGPLEIDEAVDVAAQVASGLHGAHVQGVVHRDIKPGNVIVGADGVVKIVDFGIARVAGADLSRSGRAVGTIAYMSPEQVRGESVDGQADLWALGVVLFEMILGERPFDGQTEAAILHAILHQEVPDIRSLRADVPAPVAQVVRGLLEKHTESRYQDAAAVVHDLSADAHGRARKVRSGPSHRRYNRLWRWLPGVAVGLVALAAVVLYARLNPAQPANAIAVLPLVDVSDDKESYFSEGMTDELISTLGQIEALRVISRTSAMRYRSTDRTLPQIARELKVAAIVEGTVALDSNDVRVRVRLIDGETEERLWERHFHRELRNVLALQREIAIAIAREIEVELAVRDFAGDESVVDPEAYRLYLKGMQLRNTDAPEHMRNGLFFFQAATEKDSIFARAYAATAVVAAILGGFTNLVPEAEDVARSAAARALAINPELSEGHMAQSLILQVFDWDWVGASKALRRAIESNPGNSAARYELGWLLARMGDLQEALVVTHQAHEQDPVSPLVHYLLAWIHLNNGDPEAALQFGRAIQHLEPDFVHAHLILGYTYLVMGEMDLAISEYLQLAEKSDYDVHSLGYLGHAYGVAAMRDEAMKVLADLGKMWDEGEAAAFDIAQVHAGLGNTDDAMDWLEIAYDRREASVIYLVLDPLYMQLRGEPRFEALVEKMQLRSRRP